MDNDNAQGGLLLLVGELLHKNQLLREAVASKNKAIELIMVQAISGQASTCSCGVSNQLMLAQEAIRLQDSEFAIRSECYFDDFGDIVLYSTHEMTDNSWLRGA
jgi:hypothetical protein